MRRVKEGKTMRQFHVFSNALSCRPVSDGAMSA